MPALDQRSIGGLVALNVALQLVDGVLTYLGLQAGIAEGNPLLRAAMAEIGTGPALCVAKLEACVCLLLVWHLRRSRIAAPALALCAAVYVTCAIGPWASALAQTHFAS